MPDLSVRLKLAAVWTALMFLFVCVSNLVGESWAYYLVIGVLEIGLAGLVVAYSYRWRGGSTPAQASRQVKSGASRGGGPRH